MNPPNREICSSCDSKKVRLIKQTKDGARTDNHIFVCVNKKCSIKVDLSKLKTWHQ